MSNELIILISASVMIFLIVMAIADVVISRKKSLKKRVKLLRQRMGAELPDLATAKESSVLREDVSAAPSLDKIVARMLPSSKVLSTKLSRAGISMGTGGFVTLSVFAMIGVAFAIYVFVHLSLLVSLLGGIGIGLGGAHLVVDTMIARRKAKFTKAFPDALDLIVRAVKSGLPVSEGITIVSNEMEGPVAEEFARISESMKIGETMDKALWEAAERLDNPEFNFFVISLVVQSETGGNLAETLDNLSDILRQRQTMKLKVKALASEARASAYILGALPFIMVLLLEVMSPGYTEPLYKDDMGRILTGGALVSIAMGALVMFKMVRFEA